MSRRDDVLQAALELLDEVGLDALTTRRLAERLGVQPGALYRHFVNKRALLDAMVEHIATPGQDHAIPGGDWSEQVIAAAEAMRTAMLSHRDGARLMATFAQPGPASLAGWERLTSRLRSAGASADLAASSVDTVLAYVNGFTIEEQARHSDPQTTPSRHTRDTQFRTGLDLILTGVRTTLQTPT